MAKKKMSNGSHLAGTKVFDAGIHRAEVLAQVQVVGDDGVEHTRNSFHPHLGPAALELRKKIGHFKDGTKITVENAGDHFKHDDEEGSGAKSLAEFEENLRLAEEERQKREEAENEQG